MIGLMAKKLGMTRIYSEDGVAYAVTVLEVDSSIVGHKTLENHGYIANIIGYGDKSKINKPQKYLYDQFKKAYFREVRADNESSLQEVGPVSIENIEVNQKVQVRGISKGKGFAGTMKRHNFRGGNASHGASKSHRSAGSTGQCQDPGKTFKGKKMAGHLGNEKVSVRNLKIARIDSNRNILWIHGAVPGSRNSYVEVRI